MAYRNTPPRDMRKSTESVRKSTEWSFAGTASGERDGLAGGWTRPSILSAMAGRSGGDTDIILGKPVVHEGYLAKRGERSTTNAIGRMVGGKKWHDRYFVLYEGWLAYWETLKQFQAKKSCKGLINLSDCSLATAEQHCKRLNAFGIYHTTRRDYFLEAPSSPSLSEWVTHLERMLGVGSESVVIADFEMMNFVGKGAYGKVLQVRKKDTNNIYAMKMLSKENLKKQQLGTKERKREQFERELSQNKNLSGIVNVEKAIYKHWLVESTKAERRVLEIVNHPFIVKLHFAFQTPTHLCLVMDFINGGELFSYIAKEKKFPNARAKFYTAELILALEYLHEMDIIYRDLKPENILLDSIGHIRLTDFGHSKDEHSRDDRAFSMVGSPYYMAPEILLNKGHGAEADWWSLGILAYEMLVGLPPFYQENTRKAYEELLTLPIVFPSDVNDQAKQFIRELLCVNHKERMGCGQIGMAGTGYNISEIAKKWNVPWLWGTDWSAMLAKEIPPPFKPQVKGMKDASAFSAFTSQGLESHDEDSVPLDTLGRSLSATGNLFTDFDYIAPPSAFISTPDLSNSKSPKSPYSPGMAPGMGKAFPLDPPALNLSPASSGSPNATPAPITAITKPPGNGGIRRGSAAEGLHGPVLGNPNDGIGRGGSSPRRLVHTAASKPGLMRADNSFHLSEDGDEEAFIVNKQGRPVLDRVPGSISQQLDKLVEKNRALEALQDSMMDPAMAPLVASANALLSGSHWDSPVVAQALFEAFERRQQINECFEPSAPTGEKQPHKLYEDFRAALEREIQRLGKKCKDNGKPSETSAVKPRMNSKDSEDRVRLGSLLSRGGSSRSECGSDAHQAVFDAEVREVVIQAANEEAERQAEINRLRYGSATEMPDPLTRHKSRRDVAGKQEEAAGDEEDKDTFASEQLFQPSFRKPQRKDRRVHSANDLGQWLKDQRETTVAGPSGTHSEREAGAGDADSGGREGRKA